MIVKVQIQDAHATISDSKQVILCTHVTSPLLARMGDRKLAYFHAHVSPYEIELGDAAPTPCVPNLIPLSQTAR